MRALHADYSDALSGIVVRDAALWEASLAVAGNPDEAFLVARAHGELVAYARAALLYGFVNVMELGCRPGFEGSLAALVARILEPRDADPWEPRANRPSASLRAMAISVPLQFAPDLGAALAAAGIGWRAAGDTKTMLACLDPAALAAATGERAKARRGPARLPRASPAGERLHLLARRPVLRNAR